MGGWMSNGNPVYPPFYYGGCMISRHHMDKTLLKQLDALKSQNKNINI